MGKEGSNLSVQALYVNGTHIHVERAPLAAILLVLSSGLAAIALIDVRKFIARRRH